MIMNKETRETTARPMLILRNARLRFFRHKDLSLACLSLLLLASPRLEVTKTPPEPSTLLSSSSCSKCE